MNEEKTHELAYNVAEEARKEKLLLLKVSESKNRLIEILLEMQSLANNRRIAANELANTITRLSKFDGDNGEILELEVLKAMGVDGWNHIRESAEKSQSEASYQWKKQLDLLGKMREQLIMEVLPELKNHIARRYAIFKNDIDIDILVNEGVIGVVRATEKYEKGAGKRFASYALAWADARITKMIKKREQVRTSMGKIEARMAINKCRERLMKELNRPVKDQEIIDELGIPSTTFYASQIYMSSLDASQSDEEDNETNLHNLLAKKDDCFDIFDNKTVSERLTKIIQNLSEDQRAVTLFRLPERDIAFKEVRPMPVKEAINHIRIRTTEELLDAIEEENRLEISGTSGEKGGN